jgi:hypothetical protein
LEYAQKWYEKHANQTWRRVENSKARSGEIGVVACTKKIGTSLNGEVRLLAHELMTHVLVG